MSGKKDKLDRMVTRIMRKTKGWRAKDMADDLAEYPEAHQYERKWIRDRLVEVQKSKSGTAHSDGE